MGFKLLSVCQVIEMHEKVLNEGELAGLAGDKSLEGTLARIEFHISYGFIEDVYDLAAMYAVAVSRGHVFNDANKRTAYSAMEFALIVNGVVIEFETREIGDIIIEVTKGNMDEVELASWLRKKRRECK